jgi:hypothetical protein
MYICWWVLQQGHVCLCMYIHTYIHACMHANTYLYIYTYIYYMHTDTHTYTIYIHTHTSHTPQTHTSLTHLLPCSLPPSSLSPLSPTQVKEDRNRYAQLQHEVSDFFLSISIFFFYEYIPIKCEPATLRVVPSSSGLGLGFRVYRS